MKDFKLFRLLMATTVFTLAAAGLESVAKELKVVELNCDVLGRLSIKEAAPNEDDLRNPLSDFIILTLPNGNKISMVSSPGASVRNWTSPAWGITFSQAPTWSREQVSFKRDSYGYKKGTYECDAKW